MCIRDRSRLVRAWTHLERQRGGTTFIGGPGELQIELDKRLIQSKIVRIKKRLVKVKARRKIQRKSRLNSKFQTFALVGYTNAGKTKLFNKDIENPDVIFADTTINIPKKEQYITDEMTGTGIRPRDQIAFEIRKNLYNRGLDMSDDAQEFLDMGPMTGTSIPAKDIIRYD